VLNACHALPLLRLCLIQLLGFDRVPRMSSMVAASGAPYG
jgi:hypothetical protein